MYYSLLLPLLAFWSLTVNGGDPGCTIPVWSQMSDVNRLPHMAYYKDERYQQVLPYHGDISIAAGDSLFLNCSGCSTKNYLKFAEKDSSVVVTCKKSSLHYNNNPLDFNRDVKCKNLVCNTVKKDGSCGGSGTQYQIGFEVQNGKNTHMLTDVISCYDHRTWIPLYVTHIIHGSNLRGAKQINRPEFRKAQLDNGKIIAEVFQQKNQTDIFKRLTGTETYISNTHYLEKGHLAPQGDFVFPTSQLSSYHYINVVPQWKSINNGNWKSVEYDVREFARRSLNDVVVYTGSYDVLKLNEKNVYLFRDRYLPVPKYIWKIVYATLSPGRNAAIVLIVLNNPRADQAELLCKDICGPYGWGKTGRSNLSKGHVHCCSYSEFELKVPFVPKLNVSDILSGPNPKNFA